MADDDTRGRILAAALELFCKKGFGAVGTQEICTAAGVLKGTLYHFFPGKIEIALAALGVYGGRVRGEYGVIANGRGTPAGKLGKVFAAARRGADAARDSGGAVTGCLHGNLAMELSAAEPRVRAVLAQITDDWAAALGPIFAGEPDPGAAARAVLAYLHGSVLLAKTANDPGLITALGKRAAGLLSAPAAATT